MQWKVSMIVAIGTSALLGTSCASSRKVSESVNSATNYTNVTNERDSVVVEVHDTLQVVTVVTVDRTEAGDTVRVSTVTDRERVRSRDRFKAQETRVEVRVDTVYIAVRDSVAVTTAASAPSAARASPVVSAMKWVFWIIIAIGGLVIIFKVSKVFKFLV